MKKNEIFKIYGTEYKNITKELLEHADLAGLIPTREVLIGIKPNLVAPTPASFGATTHPEVVAGIIEYLQERGFFNLVILEGSWVGDRTEESVEVCGYSKLIEQYNVRFTDTQKDRFRKVDAAGLDLEICESALELDFLINVPVLKGHCQTKVTCALKNMKGLIPNREKRHFHAMGLHKPIAHLSCGIHQDFIVVDQICGDPDCEDGGNPAVVNCVMAAKDPVLCDAYAADILGYQIEKIPYISMAEQLHVGSADISGLEVVSFHESDEKDGANIKRRHLVEVQELVEDVESCSACYACLVPALLQLQDEGRLSLIKEQIHIGQGFRNKKGRLGVGNCTKNFDQYVPGCPPTEEEIYNFLKRLTDA